MAVRKRNKTKQNKKASAFYALFAWQNLSHSAGDVVGSCKRFRATNHGGALKAHINLNPSILCDVMRCDVSAPLRSNSLICGTREL